MFWLERMYVEWSSEGTVLRREERNRETRKDLSRFSCRLTCILVTDHSLQQIQVDLPAYTEMLGSPGAVSATSRQTTVHGAPRF